VQGQAEPKNFLAMFLKTGTRAISLYAKTKPNPDISMT